MFKEVKKMKTCLIVLKLGCFELCYLPLDNKILSFRNICQMRFILSQLYVTC